MSKPSIICWDSCVLIKLLADDANAEHKKLIKSVVHLLNGVNYNLVVSTLIYTEVFETKMSADAKIKFQEMLNDRRMTGVITMDKKVALKAQVLRRRVGNKLRMPDAIHLATAIVSGAVVFHTFDKKLLRLSNSSEVEKLPITECKIPGTTGIVFDF